MKLSEVKVAPLGQPNSGKSTVFNQLTGARQHVGNWPGKTVEKKDGSLGKPAILILNMMDVAEKKWPVHPRSRPVRSSFYSMNQLPAWITPV